MRRKLLLAFALPTVLLFTLFGLVALDATRRDLDSELGARLSSVAAAAATQLRGKYLLSLGPGNEDDRSYQNAVKKLQLIEQASQVRLFVIDQGFGVRVDTRGSAIGGTLFTAQLDRVELAALFASGKPQSSVTFTGNDGVNYKTGYAAVHADDDDNSTVLAIGAQAPAEYFSRLSDLRTSLLYWGGVLVVLILLAVLGATFWITRSVRRLVLVADQMKAGDLHRPVTVPKSDDLSVLAETLESMRLALNKRDADRAAMLAGIAHEVRNPLAGMMLYTGILRDELAGDAERLGHVAKIAKELGYLDRVVNEFLDFSGKRTINASEFALAPLLGELAELVATPSQLVQVDCADGFILRVDRDQVRRALLNLMTNAAQASDGSPVTVRAIRMDGGSTIEVVNSGSEISKDAQRQMFDPFYTTKEKGTGLGLALVRNIAQLHGGDIDYLRRDGQTVLRLRFPAIAVDNKTS